MRKELLLPVAVAAFILAANVANAQHNSKRMELSIAGSIQAFVEEGETEHYLNIPFRVGGYATPNVLIEVEAILSGWDEQWAGDTQIGYVISLLGSYNFTSEKVTPFLLTGIGFSNGVPLANAIAFGDKDGPKPLVLNAGAGLKIPVGEEAAMRLEYRMQDFSGDKTHSTYYGTFTQEIDVTLHSIFFGVSLFL